MSPQTSTSRAQHVVHQRLECCQRVGEPEQHDQKLVVAMVHAEGGLSDVIEVHPHLVVARSQVELSEETSPTELIKELVHHRDREFVLGRLGVDGAVVDAKPSRRVCLTDQQHRHGKRRSAWPDDALGEHGLTLALQLILLQLGAPLRPNGDRRHVRQQVDVVVVRPRRWKPAQLLKGGRVLLEEGVQQVLLDSESSHRGLLGGRGCLSPAHALLVDLASTMPECHGLGRQVPRDGAKHAQEVVAEDEVETTQVNVDARDGEGLALDGDGDVPSDAGVA